MKKRFLIVFVLLLVLGSIAAWLILGSATGFKGDKEYLFIYEGKPVKEQVMKQIKEKKIVRFPALFNAAAERADVWKKLKPGRFEIKQGDNLITIIRMLRNNTQSAVKMIITKLRTRNDFAGMTQRLFNIDSSATMQFISNNDSIQRWGVDTATFLTVVIPDTYEMYWTSDVRKVIDKLHKASKKFWDIDRLKAVQKMNITSKQAYTVASIVEEETNAQQEKGTIASVYLNRLQKGMPLGADPTVKFALRDFGLRRILYGHLEVQSPYNTYRNKGLPPGPICTPSKKTLDAVLHAPSTNYLYFVASDKFDGTHNFSENYAQHLQLAKQYQAALDVYLKNKENK
jgi:UPF0755 protein